MSKHEEINNESRGAFDIKMHRNTWHKLYEEYHKELSRVQEVTEQAKILVEALELSIQRACVQCSADRIAHTALAEYKGESNET
jgi:hypothetical protein